MQSSKKNSNLFEFINFSVYFWGLFTNDVFYFEKDVRALDALFSESLLPKCQNSLKFSFFITHQLHGGGMDEN